MKLSKVRLVKFLIVGGIGVGINYIVFWSLRKIMSLDIAWIIGIGISATSNYVLNELWTWGGNS